MSSNKAEKCFTSRSQNIYKDESQSMEHEENQDALCDG